MERFGANAPSLSRRGLPVKDDGNSDKGLDSGYATATSTASARSSGGASARGSVGEYTPPVASRWQKFQQAELDFLFALQRLRRRIPLSIRWLADRLISSHPLYDLSLAVWMAVPPAMYYTGPPVMWMLTANIFLSFGLAWVVGGATPSERDPRLKPRGRVSPSGFPCIELQLAVTLFATLCAYLPGNAAAIAACAGLLLLLLLLRLYALTHFPHQLAASALLGSLTVPVLRSAAGAAFPRGLPPRGHLLAGIFVGFIFVGYIAYKAETNDAPVLRVPKAEFVRVLTDIMAGDDTSVSQARTAATTAAATLPSAAEGEGSGGARRRRGVRFDGGGAGAGGGGGGTFPPAGPRLPPAGPVGAGTGLRPPAALALPPRLPPAGPQHLQPQQQQQQLQVQGDEVRQARAQFARAALASLAGIQPGAGGYADNEEDEGAALLGSPTAGIGIGIGSGSGSGEVGELAAAAAAAAAAMREPPRRDSFYYLMRGMQRRSGGGGGAAAASSSSSSNPWG